MNLNRLLGIEIYVIHVGHFLLFLAALVILALNVPWWAVLVAAPLVAPRRPRLAVRGVDRPSRREATA